MGRVCNGGSVSNRIYGVNTTHLYSKRKKTGELKGTRSK